MDKQQIQKFFSNNVNQKEVTELNNGYANEDVITIIGYLNDDTKLKSQLTIPHDWAGPLQTVGTLATELLAELFEQNEEDQGNDELSQVNHIIKSRKSRN